MAHRPGDVLFRVFVLELDSTVGETLRANRPPMFVGRAPNEDFEEQIAGLISGSVGPSALRGHVVQDRPDLYRRYLPKIETRAKKTEDELACRLIRRWYDVFGRRRYRMYVIELDPSIKYPGSDRPWVYVGLTSKTPEQRFHEHKIGARNRRGRLYNTDARDYGVGLWEKYYAHIPPCCTLAEAKEKEKDLALRLHRKGFRVEGDGLPPELRGT